MAPAPSQRRIRICIDRGGTFTDCIAFYPSKDGTKTDTLIVKLLSVDPQSYDDAPREGIRRILEQVTGEPHPRNVPVDTSRIELIRMGTTVATNALLERNGDPCALVITKGFKNLLHIGNQSRPKIFDLAITIPDVLYSQVVEVNERVRLVGKAALSDDDDMFTRNDARRCEKGVTGEWVEILDPLDLAQVKADLTRVYASGIRSVAICLMHSFTFPRHEQAVADVAHQVGFANVTLSSAIMPMVKILPRTASAMADAYLTPGIKAYIEGFFRGFDEHIRDPSKVRIEFMQSDGGLTPVQDFCGFRAMLSGPAGGVVGYAMTSFHKEPVIGFDMGGTSTDVSRYAGNYEHVFESTTAGITIQAPQLDINTVAAGGGSRLFFRNGLFVVGPESAGANPGPACYRKKGPLTVTDANLFLGRLVASHFPSIFGPNQNEPLDLDASRTAFKQLAADVNASLGAGEHMSTDEVAFGFIKVANEAMCRPIRALTQAKGHDVADHVLACFGGAGGQHACAIARSLGIKKILVHRYSSILSAYGIALADVVHEEQEPSAHSLSPSVLPTIAARVQALKQTCTSYLADKGFEPSAIELQVYLNLRYQGTDHAMMTQQPLDGGWNGFEKAFTTHHQQEFGFVLKDRDIVIDDIRVRGIGKSAVAEDDADHNVFDEFDTLIKCEATNSIGTQNVYWESGRQPTPVFSVDTLHPGAQITGPALIIDQNATIALEPNCKATMTSRHLYIETLEQQKEETVSTAYDPIKLSVFAHRFMSVAEQMGTTLQKTAISTNIKERLDFSCALFGPDGGLVANAPHIPVHLGSMQEAVRWQMRNTKFEDGDVLLSNHPSAGGSHLPDITVITPVFNQGVVEFFVASRGHHADIGGIRPGSMPPDSRELYQEGAAIKSFHLVRNNQFDEAGIKHLLVDQPAQYPKCSGSRCVNDCISDLKAQAAANHRGITLVRQLIEEYGLETVQAYMGFIRANAENAVRALLKEVGTKHRTHNKDSSTTTTVLTATDRMDDGTPIALTVTIDTHHGSATFDFTGTGPELYGNTNAPRAITYSAIIYCLRCMISSDIPLNQGALNPVTVVIPAGSILSPTDGAAVVGGNVLTSQRVVDVVLKAFDAAAASQGCCNNLTFGRGGDNGFGYYETIAGGSGAGPTWDGRSGVHTHMTNTRITDPEILERRYPVLLREFSLRPNSGGRGLHRGGDGCIRDIEFLAPLQLSILSERRVFPPYGAHGGHDGQPGRNTLIRKDGRCVNFGGKNVADVHVGDRVRIETPGGGGWGIEK
ncbi:hypothetical protein PhCBS80983_g06072 [Powellomyces hirtus]|uniref:5-oxoprolinase (ATP-hydrolysing) n=1 Tax=Powellomyces hirtus TaxID=109895 RepID=A0A507DRZ3_9FUNG|nr:hypothetical protein PhCBS80983_g06072 [Powellomyces hirtus]